jgi:hypothetical protein
MFFTECPPCSRMQIRNLRDHPCNNESYNGNWVKKEEWTGEAVEKNNSKVDQMDNSRFEVEITLTRHRERPFGVPAEGVRELGRRGEE